MRIIFNEIMKYMSTNICFIFINNIFIVIDPITKLNAGKSTFRISEIKNIFEEIFHYIENYRNLYDNNNLNNDLNLLEEIINKFK